MAKFNNFRHVWLDTETSGFMPDGEIIEIAMIITDKDHLEHGRLNLLIKPNTDYWSVEAEAVHKITRESLDENGMDYQAALTEIKLFLEKNDICRENKAMPCGQNVNFDLEFLKAFMGREYWSYFGYHTIDTMHTAKFVNDVMIKTFGFQSAPFLKDEKPSASLDAQRDYFGISKEGNHRAIKDVEDTLECYKGTLDAVSASFKAKSVLNKLKGVLKDLLD
jgi:DNA polymerase III epsilon subunit-like protein